jgi:hypothetical protein
MLKSKQSLEQYLAELCDRIVLDNDKCKDIYNYANKTYGIPKGLVSDLVTKRMEMSEVSEFVLFILLDSICNINKNKGLQTIDKFYTMQEAKYYRTSKYEVKKIKFPLVFKMVQIAEDQWTGKITVDMLMQLRQAQLINYNVNAQRTMQRVVRGDKESYKITLNQKAVENIQTSFENNSFIPNTITLNIPMETDFDFYYDEESCSLIIKSLEHLDVTDGYHRYIAACQTKDKNQSFDYPMELRIVNFTEDKAKQFIWQEDQKTKMRKIDSNSMNMNSAANIVVTRLNENIRCNLKGLISRNDGIIPFGEFAELVDYFYFKGIGKEKEKSTIIRAVKELTDNFNMLTEYNMEYLEHKMSYKTLLVAMFCFDYFKDDDANNSNVCEIIERAAREINNSTNKKFQNKTPRRSLMVEVEEIVKGAI